MKNYTNLEMLASAAYDADDKHKSRVWFNLGQIPADFTRGTDHIGIDFIKEKLGRKWQGCLAQVLKLGRVVRGMSIVDGMIREVPLSSTSDKLQKAVGLSEPKNVRKCIENAHKLGVLILTDNTYVTGMCGRKYAFNDEVWTRLLSVVCDPSTKVSQVLLSSISYIMLSDSRDSSTQTDEDSNVVGFGDSFGDSNVVGFEDAEEDSNVVGFRFDFSYNRQATDEEVIRGLHKTYPWLRYYQDKVARLNPRLDASNQMRFEPSVNRNKGGKVAKVGIRCTSEACSSESQSRKTVLRQKWGRKVYDYDVKSSIYRVTYFLNHLVWLPYDVDLYVQMMGVVPMQRATFKKMSMGLYFGKTEKQSWCWMCRKLRQRHIDWYTDEDKEAYYEMWHKMREVVGKSYSSEIFFHESCIYLDLLEALLDRGYTITQVYDGFYSDRPLHDVCESLLPIIARNYAIRIGLIEGEMSDLPEDLDSHFRGSDSEEDEDSNVVGFTQDDSHNDEDSNVVGFATETDDFMINETNIQTDEDFLNGLTQPDVVIIPTTAKRTTIADIEAQQDADLEEVFALAEDDGEQDTAAPTMDSILDEFFADGKEPQKVAYEVRPLDVLLDELEAASSGSGTSSDKCANTWQHARYIDEAHRREEAINRGKRDYMTW